MPTKSMRFCAHPGCTVLTDGRYCQEHATLHGRVDQRASAGERGYDWKWNKFRNWYLRQPGNQLCKLHISSRCTVVADCVDHIVPLELGGAKYDLSNLQPSCRNCNVAKGRKILRGTYTLGDAGREGAGGSNKH